jgi:hypothetical protein
MPATMRVSLLLIAAIFCSMLLGCGSVNDKHRMRTGLNPHDPMMTSRYLTNRAGR